MPTLAELKAQSPAYANMSDEEFAGRLYRKHYADKMTLDEFAKRIGYGQSDPTEGMSTFDKLAAGAGKSVADTWQGLKQLVGAASQQEVDARRQADAPLMDSGAGKAGYVLGTVGQIVGPGGVLKMAAKAPALARAAPVLNTASRAFLPNTARGAFTQGVALGAVQPVSEGESRALNATLGGAAGGLGVLIPRAAGATYRAGRNAITAPTTSGAQREAVRTIRSLVDDPNVLMQPAPSAIPGVRRTLFEESLVPGVARLETKARGANGDFWANFDAANDTARQAAIGRFAGDEAAIGAAEKARFNATNPLYTKAKKVTGVDTSRLVDQIRRLESAQDGRPAVQSGLAEVRRLLEGKSDMRSIGNVRKTIGDMLDGKYGGDTSRALAGSRELLAVRNQLDRVAAKASPEFKQATQTFRDMSKPINRMQAGQELLQRGTSAITDPISGLNPLQPGRFGGQVKNLDAVAQKATGFRKAQAANVFRPEDMQTIGAVNDDLSRQAARLKYGNGGGSHTASQAELGLRLAGKALFRKVPWLGQAVEYLDNAAQDRVASTLAEMLANPAEYRRVAAALPAEERKLVEQAFVRLGGTTGAISPALVNGLSE